MKMFPTSSLSSPCSSSSSTDRWRECCTESLCCCSCSRKSPNCSWKTTEILEKGANFPWKAESYEKEVKLFLKSVKKMCEKYSNLYEECWILERKWGDHHGVKSDMMDALLSIDVNPHLRIVGWDHCLPYWHLAQGPPPSQIRLKRENLVTSQSGGKWLWTEIMDCPFYTLPWDCSSRGLFCCDRVF